MLELSHRAAVSAAYAVALAAWIGVDRLFPSLWPRRERPRFERPWLELVLALAAVLGVLAVGQLYLHEHLLPRAEGVVGVLAEAGNQVLVYAPVPLLLALRRNSLHTAWLPAQRLPARLASGVALAALALAVFGLVREGAPSQAQLFACVVRPAHFPHLVQVALEDLCIAVLFVRASAALGALPSTLVVAVLFAAGHVPALLEGGAGPEELAGLLVDAGLVLFVLLTLQRAQDIAWFACVHFALDATQFCTPG